MRAQIDRDLYRRNMQEALRGVAGLEIREDSVEDLVLTEMEGEGEEGGRGREEFAVGGVCLGKEGAWLDVTLSRKGKVTCVLCVKVLLCYF